MMQDKAAAYGVKRPMQRHAAGKHSPTIIESAVGQCAVPSATSVAPTEMRKTKSAAPADPVGNIENSLCTYRRLAVARACGNPERRGSYHPLVGCESDRGTMRLCLPGGAKHSRYDTRRSKRMWYLKTVEMTVVIGRKHKSSSITVLQLDRVKCCNVKGVGVIQCVSLS